MISPVMRASRCASTSSRPAKRCTCAGSSAASPSASARRPTEAIGVLSSWLMFATKSRRTSSRRCASVRSSTTMSTKRAPSRATLTLTSIVCSPKGPRASSSSSAIGSPVRRTRPAKSSSSWWASVCPRTSPMASAPGDARSTLFEGSTTTPAESSTSSTWSTPSGTLGVATFAALCPRRSAMCSTTMKAAPRKRPRASAATTTQVESMAPTLTMREGRPSPIGANTTVRWSVFRRTAPAVHLRSGGLPGRSEPVHQRVRADAREV